MPLIGEIVQLLEHLLRTENRHERTYLIELHRLVRDDRLLIPFFLDLGSPLDDKAKRAAVAAFHRIEAHAVPAQLILLLDDDNSEIRSSATQVIYELAAPETRPLLESVLADSDPAVRAIASFGLGRE